MALRARAFAAGSKTVAQGRSLILPSPFARSTRTTLPTVSPKLCPPDGMLAAQTRRGGPMEKLRSLLELYGALDEAVVQSDDPLVANTVDRFLPGASANRKWYREIERFFFSEAPGGAREVPNLGEALGRIAAAH